MKNRQEIIPYEQVFRILNKVNSYNSRTKKARTILPHEHLDYIFKEYKERQSLEAKIVKDADNLEVDLELKELEERGSLLPKKWQEFRRKVRDEKLYTGSAKELWDEIQKADVSSWHLAANKWLKIPEAGK